MFGRRYLAFDLEIARVIPDGVEDWSRFRPFGITCAATVEIEGTPKIWHGHTPDGGIAAQMSREEAAELVAYLEAEVAAGKTLLTWNGAGFDFSVLAEESGQLSTSDPASLDYFLPRKETSMSL